MDTDNGTDTSDTFGGMTLEQLLAELENGAFPLGMNSLCTSWPMADAASNLKRSATCSKRQITDRIIGRYARRGSSWLGRRS